MLQKHRAHLKQRLPTSRSPHPIQKLAPRLHTQPDEVEMLLNPVHPLFLRVTLVRHRLIQRLQIPQHLPPRRLHHLPTRRRRADLLKQPRIPNRPPPQHQPPRSRLRQHPQRRLRRVHIAVRQHRTPHHFHRTRNEIVVHLRPIHLPHRPPVHRQNIRLMPRINRQQRLKLRQ